MLNMEEWMDIKSLYKEGCKIREIVRVTGYSRNTVRKVLRRKYSEKKTRKKSRSITDGYKEYISKRYYECALSAVRIYEEIKRMGYSGSVDSVRVYLRTLKSVSGIKGRMTGRFETPPGKQAQVDWGHCGNHELPCGGKLKVYVFTMVLSYSRMLYIEFTTSMKLDKLIQCHINAFNYFCGWTETILYDNMKQILLSPGRFSPLFADFAEYYGFTPKTCRPYRARTKGKVERMVEYVKDNFLNGRIFTDIDDLNSQARVWLNSANTRIHGTTKEKPCVLFGKEGLTAHQALSPYKIISRETRKVNSEGKVCFKGSSYTVPPEAVGKMVFVESHGQKIIIRSDSLIIAEHRKASKPGSLVADEKHIAEMWKLTLGNEHIPEKAWHLTFKDAVETRALTDYERAVLA